jgi:hypothetical protein
MLLAPALVEAQKRSNSTEFMVFVYKEGRPSAHLPGDIFCHRKYDAYIVSSSTKPSTKWDTRIAIFLRSERVSLDMFYAFS